MKDLIDKLRDIANEVSISQPRKTIAEQAADAIERLIEERDAALFASRYEADLCQQALESLKEMTAERDAANAALQEVLKHVLKHVLKQEPT